jgi:DNA-binding response OmpR family regulator
VQRHGVLLDLTQKEFELSWYLFSQLGRLLSRAQIMQAVWGLDSAIETRTLDTHMSRLRRKLSLTPEHGFRLVSVYNFGYRLESTTAPRSPGPLPAAARGSAPATTL